MASGAARREPHAGVVLGYRNKLSPGTVGPGQPGPLIF